MSSTFHAVRNSTGGLKYLLPWSEQIRFAAIGDRKETPRNLFGFKDGTATSRLRKILTRSSDWQAIDIVLYGFSPAMDGNLGPNHLQEQWKIPFVATRSPVPFANQRILMKEILFQPLQIYMSVWPRSGSILRFDGVLFYSDAVSTNRLGNLMPAWSYLCLSKRSEQFRSTQTNLSREGKWRAHLLKWLCLLCRRWERRASWSALFE